MISALMNVDEQFAQFDDISINVKQGGVQLRMKKNWKEAVVVLGIFIVKMWP